MIIFYSFDTYDIHIFVLSFDYNTKFELNKFEFFYYYSCEPYWHISNNWFILKLLEFYRLTFQIKPQDSSLRIGSGCYSKKIVWCTKNVTKCASSFSTFNN